MTQANFNKEFKRVNPNYLLMRVKDRCSLYNKMKNSYLDLGILTEEQMSKWKLPVFLADQTSKIQR